jgi:YD repeat-containing protein
MDGAGRLQQVVDRHGLAQTFGYDALGRPQQVQSVDGGLTTFGFAGSGVVISEPGNRLVVLDVEPGGPSRQLAGLTDVDGNERTFAYDAENRLTRDTWLTVATGFSRVTAVAYDPDGHGTVASVDRGTDPDPPQLSTKDLFTAAVLRGLQTSAASTTTQAVWSDPRIDPW